MELRIPPRFDPTENWNATECNVLQHTKKSATPAYGGSICQSGSYEKQDWTSRREMLHRSRVARESACRVSRTRKSCGGQARQLHEIPTFAEEKAASRA